MLPADLLVTKASRGKIQPVFAEANEENLEIVTELIEVFDSCVGKKREALDEILEEYENGCNYKFIKGICTLLERRCEFEAQSVVEPLDARRLVFKEANNTLVTDSKSRNDVLSKVASTLGISKEELDKSLWADLDSETVLTSFRPIKSLELLQKYNLSLAQTLLFNAISMEIQIKGDYKRMFGTIKYFGLMYLAEKRDDGFYITINGAVSLFKMSRKYGTALAKLLTIIINSPRWSIKASIIRKVGKEPKILEFTMDHSTHSNRFNRKVKSTDLEFDSSVEEKFAISFTSLNNGWKLIREPEPLIAGSSVLIPDFSFEKGNMKVYLEIVGFWTDEYLKKKVDKLRQIAENNIIIAVDRKLACSKVPDIGKVIFYDKKVPIQPIMRYLKQYEEKYIQQDIDNLADTKIEPEGDVISIKVLAETYGVSIEAIKRVFSHPQYELFKNVVVDKDLLSTLRGELKGMSKYSEVAEKIEANGLNPVEILDKLGFKVVWQGLDVNNAVIQHQ